MRFTAPDGRAATLPVEVPKIAEYAIGLSGRYSLEGRGMVFYYPGSQGNSGFWMKNTLLPLTAAFVADDGTIVNLADMAPQTTQSHCSAKPVRFVLEMHQGWFAKRGIQAGFKLGGAPFDQKR